MQVLPVTWAQVLRGLYDQVASSDSFREALPVGFAADPAGLAQALGPRLAELAAQLAKLDVEQVAAGVGQRFLDGLQPSLHGQLQALSALADVDDGTVLGRRPGTAWRIEPVDDGELAVHGNAGTFRLPADQEPALRRLLTAAGGMRVAELEPMLPDAAARAELVRLLVRNGLLIPLT